MAGRVQDLLTTPGTSKRPAIQPAVDEAFGLYAALIEACGKGLEDPLLRLMQRRCELIKRQVRDGVFAKERWDGVYEFSSK